MKKPTNKLLGKLSGKIALVTGSSRGIGAAIALAFAREGADIIVTYNSNEKEAKNISKKLNTLGVRTFIVQMDVATRSSVVHAVKEAINHFKRIDILVNNAGINITNDFDKITDNDWDQVVDVDMKGPFIVTQEVLKFMKKQKSGNIINIASLSGEDGGPRTPSYAAAKAGVIALTLNEAIFCAKYNIRVNCISPGVIASELTDQSMHPAIKKQRLEQILLKRFGKYEELGPPAVFLASEDSSFITGEILHVNGGAHLKL